MGSDFSARLDAFAARFRQEIAVNVSAASQIALVGLIPFLPFILQFDHGSLRPTSRTSLLIAAGCVLVALLSRWVFFVFALVYVTLTVASVHIIRHFGGDEHGWRLDQPDSRIEVFFESPPNEKVEYFQTHWWPSDWVLSGLAVLYLVVLGYVLRTRHGLTAAAKGAVALALVVCSALVVHYLTRNTAIEWPQYQLAHAAFEGRLRFQKLAGRSAFLAEQPLPPGDCTRRYKKIVIVLGESANSGHMSAFGYGRKTTPFADESAPHVFEALSPANVTRLSLAMTLTAVRPGNFDSFYQTPSLVSQLRACGYETLWISNQGRTGRHDSVATSIAREADQQVFLNELSYKEAKHDGQIVSELERLGAFEATAHATFIHLIGSHTRYDRRYPHGFGFPDLKDTVDAYDNSILYTDFVLSQLYQSFGSDELLFVYVADHGEVVSNGLFGHGFTPGYQDEYQVPLLIWTDDAASMSRLRAAIGTARLNLESFDDLINYLIGSTSTPAVSTSSVVTHLSPGNAVRYEDLRSIQPQGSKTDQ